MSLGLFVEGPSDKDAISILIRKIRNQKVIPRVVPRGDMFSAEKMRGYIIPLLQQHVDISKIIVCVDLECTEPSETEGRARRVEQQLARLGLKPIPSYVVVVHALEGWLAADVDAVGKVVGRGAEVAAHIPQDLKGVCKPADLLDEIFDKYGKAAFRKTQHNPLIAYHADPAKIVRRNTSFQRFQEAIEDP